MRLFYFCILASLSPPAFADTVLVGSFSYDTFIPTTNGSRGVNAFDLANLTGAFSLPPDFPVTDSVTWLNAVLTVTLSDSSHQVFSLADFAPGFLLDSNGSPVVQVPSDESFAAAELTATMSPTTFVLSDGSRFTAGSAAIDVTLLPSSGNILVQDVDQTAISISGPTAVSEPASIWMMLTCLGLVYGLKTWFHRDGAHR